MATTTDATTAIGRIVDNMNAYQSADPKATRTPRNAEAIAAADAIVSDLEGLSPDLAGALMAGLDAADRYSVANAVDIASPGGDKHAQEQWLGAAEDMANALEGIRAALPHRWLA